MLSRFAGTTKTSPMHASTERFSSNTRILDEIYGNVLKNITVLEGS